MERETGRFTALSDDGEQFTVVEFSKVMRTRAFPTRDQAMFGARRYVLEDGSGLNRLDAETFEIAQSHRIIRKG